MKLFYIISQNAENYLRGREENVLFAFIGTLWTKSISRAHAIYSSFKNFVHHNLSELHHF